MSEQTATPFLGLQEAGITTPHPVYQGKVREVVDLDSRVLLVTTDRISAFDRILGAIPYKGEVLNRLACWWLDKASQMVPTHFIQRVGSRSMLVHKARVLPVEVIVRGYLTGSAWRDYQAGKPTSGLHFPPGMKKNQQFTQPVITPSTKAEMGLHDEPVSSQEVVSRGLVSPEIWQQITDYAYELFAFGSRIAEAQGLILVDTKYEFGILPDGKVVVVDEIHTPDSSRYWFSQGYPEALEQGRDPRSLDKEFLRSWLLERGFSGEGPAPAMPDELILEISKRYQDLYSLITGEKFQTISKNPQSETADIMVIIGGKDQA